MEQIVTVLAVRTGIALKLNLLSEIFVLEKCNKMTVTFTSPSPPTPHRSGKSPTTDGYAECYEGMNNAEITLLMWHEH